MLSPFAMIRPRRKVVGMSAILLPFRTNGGVDWDGFRRHVSRTADSGLTPAVNMDTGYANLIDEPTRERVLAETAAVLCSRKPNAASIPTIMVWGAVACALQCSTSNAWRRANPEWMSGRRCGRCRRKS